MSDIVGDFYLNGKIAQVLHAKHSFIYSTFSKQKLSEFSRWLFEQLISAHKFTKITADEFSHLFDALNLSEWRV